MDVAVSNLASDKGISFYSMFEGSDIVIKIVIIVLILTSIWCWAIIFSKWLRFRFLKFQFSSFEKAFWASDSLDDFYEKQKRKKRNPLAVIFVEAMDEWYLCHDEDTSKITQEAKLGLKDRVDRIMGVTRNREMEKLEGGLGFLATVSSTAPFLGLFGTVWGIMNSFTAIGAMKSVTLAVVAPGIAEALLTTAVGLLAAIPAAVAYNHFEGNVVKFAGGMEDFSEEFNTLLSRQIDIEEGVNE